MYYKIYPKLGPYYQKGHRTPISLLSSILIKLSVPWSTWEAINFPNRKNYVAGDLAIKVINNKLRY